MFNADNDNPTLDDIEIDIMTYQFRTARMMQKLKALMDKGGWR